jgi:hypothetical protein
MTRFIALRVALLGACLVIWSGYSAWDAGLGGLGLRVGGRWWTGWWAGWALVTVGFVAQWSTLWPRIKQVPDFSGPHGDFHSTELTEFNERGRQYGAQLWHVPFAYVGIVGAVMSQVAAADDKGNYDVNLIFPALIASAVFGIVALLHMTTLLDGNRRAVANIQGIESFLGVPVDARAQWSIDYALPLFLLVILTIAVCVWGAVILPL